MEDWLNIPMNAILSFEHVTGLSVTIHEVSGALWPFVSPERHLHMNPVCVAAKSAAMAECVRFDAVDTRAAMAHQTAGRVHVCHAGVVEWVVPSIRDGRLQRVFFAGQRRPGKHLTAAQGASVNPHKAWTAHVAALQPVEDQEAHWLLESLRQLAARIELWDLNPPPETLHRDAAAFPATLRTATALRQYLTQRQHAIAFFIQAHHREPLSLADVAEYLHISESRAGHAVKQACGRTFMELLSDARLRTAASLLQNTSLPVSEVAESSGFGNVSHFHHTFRQRFKTTPHQYRKQAEHKLRVIQSQGRAATMGESSPQPN
jgi:AraC-like DNA-binding protein